MTSQGLGESMNAFLPSLGTVAKGGLLIVVAGALSLGDGTGSSRLSQREVQEASRANWTSTGATASADRNTTTAIRQVATRSDVDGIGPDPGIDTATLVTELRLRSGLTWDQVARIFGVERRSVHFWASGRQMNAENAERLGRVYAAIAAVDRGDPASTRAWLVAPLTNGLIPLDLLRMDRSEEVIRIGAGEARPTQYAPRISAAAAAARAPRSPVQLIASAADSLPLAKAKHVRSIPLKSTKRS